MKEPGKFDACMQIFLHDILLISAPADIETGYGYLHALTLEKGYKLGTLTPNFAKLLNLSAKFFKSNRLLSGGTKGFDKIFTSRNYNKLICIAIKFGHKNIHAKFNESHRTVRFVLHPSMQHIFFEKCAKLTSYKIITCKKCAS